MFPEVGVRRLEKMSRSAAGWAAAPQPGVPTTRAAKGRVPGPRKEPFRIFTASQFESMITPSPKRYCMQIVSRGLSSARVAQSVERQALNLVVVGSSPTAGDVLLRGVRNISDASVFCSEKMSARA